MSIGAMSADGRENLFYTASLFVVMKLLFRFLGVNGSFPYRAVLLKIPSTVPVLQKELLPNGLYFSGSSWSTLVNCIGYASMLNKGSFVVVAIDPYKKLERFVELKRVPSDPAVFI